MKVEQGIPKRRQ